MGESEPLSASLVVEGSIYKDGVLKNTATVSYSRALDIRSLGQVERNIFGHRDHIHVETIIPSFVLPAREDVFEVGERTS